MEYLTLSELKTLQGNTHIPHPISRLAMLFACYTGLQPHDLCSLQFDHIHHSGTGLMVVKQQSVQDGSLPIRVPLGKMAKGVFDEVSRLYAELPEAMQDGFLFHSADVATMNSDIRKWVFSAGIQRDIDLSAGSNTFCVLALQAGISQKELAEWCGSTVQAISKYQPLALPTCDKDIEAFDALFLPYLC